MQVQIRAERPSDVDAIGAINEAAFGQSDEARLVEALRADGDVVLSLVAQRDASVVGHLLLSAAQIVGASGEHDVLALAPMAVMPSEQRSGVGSLLVRAAIERATAADHRAVVVLGHPAFYPRFGFEPAGPHALRCPYEAPPEAFMVLGLRPDALGGLEGTIRYSPAFGAPA